MAWLAVGLVATGSSVAFYRGQGAAQPNPEARRQGAAVRPDEKGRRSPVQISPEGPPALSDRTQSRLTIGRQIRDHYFRLYQAGEVDLEAYLRWQMRYADLIETEVGRQSKDFDPVKFLEVELKGIQRLEKRSRGTGPEGTGEPDRCPDRRILPPGDRGEARAGESQGTTGREPRRGREVEPAAGPNPAADSACSACYRAASMTLSSLVGHAVRDIPSNHVTHSVTYEDRGQAGSQSDAMT